MHIWDSSTSLHIGYDTQMTIMAYRPLVFGCAIDHSGLMSREPRLITLANLKIKWKKNINIMDINAKILLLLWYIKKKLARLFKPFRDYVRKNYIT